MTFRDARAEDLSGVLQLLADGQTEEGRETVSAPSAGQTAAFEEISADPNQRLICAVDDDVIVGTVQLTFTSGLARNGTPRLHLEAMRVHRGHQKRGVGTTMIRWAIDRAQERGCSLVQLTSDTSRTAARRFYETQGFTASHAGFKLFL